MASKGGRDSPVIQNSQESLSGRKGAKSALGANAEIGRKLKQYYDSILTEEVPDRFSDLLGQLEEAEKSAKD